ncbi:hypothetical protein BC829DRAFT_400502 [Chytridium lagenaria]|nr:hypothetical protein BC829DRAFT_400502 [Chytridium lagenaria]
MVKKDGIEMWRGRSAAEKTIKSLTRLAATRQKDASADEEESMVSDSDNETGILDEEVRKTMESASVASVDQIKPTVSTPHRRSLRIASSGSSCTTALTSSSESSTPSRASTKSSSSPFVGEGPPLPFPALSRGGSGKLKLTPKASEAVLVGSVTPKGRKNETPVRAMLTRSAVKASETPRRGRSGTREDLDGTPKALLVGGRR